MQKLWNHTLNTTWGKTSLKEIITHLCKSLYIRRKNNVHKHRRVLVTYKNERKKAEGKRS